jgi:hypothetical protein
VAPPFDAMILQAASSRCKCLHGSEQHFIITSRISAHDAAYCHAALCLGRPRDRGEMARWSAARRAVQRGFIGMLTPPQRELHERELDSVDARLAAAASVAADVAAQEARVELAGVAAAGVAAQPATISIACVQRLRVPACPPRF